MNKQVPSMTMNCSIPQCRHKPAVFVEARYEFVWAIFAIGNKVTQL